MHPERVVQARAQALRRALPRAPAAPAFRSPPATVPRRLSAAVAAPGRGYWALAAALAAADAVWAWAAGIAIEPAGMAAAAGIVAALLAAAALLGPVKSEPCLRGMALGTAFLVAFTVPAALLHTLAAGLDRPLVDPILARAEAALGFDWPAYVAALAGHPDLARGLALAYHTSGPQVGLVVIALAGTRRLGRLWAFARLFALTLLCVIAVSALWPALGPYAHYAPRIVPSGELETAGALWHLEPVARLRAGTLDHLALSDLRGLAVFPSFHVCLAILTAWALAPVPVLGPLAALLNAAVIVGTLGAGGHYLPDLIAGAALALAALALRAAGRRTSGFRKGEPFRGCRVEPCDVRALP
ncbi:phosphatase PAP2 family protein [Methylobacterium sp. NEAU 140]|uniref:phosphatase PAP2 family protein n=1 Tax=Methylobacterium sp. NEAU 140 TaxID=3064945 RepID=UPI00273262B9|nr:phosphatase PAP2 family protein [Methylobacterium sp. NEAU 140]MDP4024009.1 phosphatase PAP2 family protein [Methylobacterium sp. NEAU 140]